MAAGRRPGPCCAHTNPVDIGDGTLCLAASPKPGPLRVPPALLVGDRAKSVPQMTHVEKMEEAIRRAHEKGHISDEVLHQLPSVKQLVLSIAIVGGVLVGLGVTAAAVASTGVGAVLEGIAAAIVVALAALGIVSSAGQIVAGIKMLTKFYTATQKAHTLEELDAAGKDFATGVAEVGVGVLMMILSVLGAKQGFKIGRGAVEKWNAGPSHPAKPVSPAENPPSEPQPKPAPPEPPRLPQDKQREDNYPDPPAANNGNSTIGPNPNQNAALQRDIQQAIREGAKDVRVNQEQVNAQGVRVGQNRPDLQYTDKNGIRHYVEYDTSPENSAAHADRIRANDPAGVITPKIIK